MEAKVGKTHPVHTAVAMEALAVAAEAVQAVQEEQMVMGAMQDP